MRKKGIITMAVRESAMDAFGRFLLTKRANGVKTKTIETYSQHFHAISKHLDVSQEIAGMTAEDLRNMVISMQVSGLSPNSIKSYTITLKAFLSWCKDNPCRLPKKTPYINWKLNQNTKSNSNELFQIYFGLSPAR